jgi:ribose transport system permease protein
MLLAAGQTYVIISGGIDLSDGAILGLSAMGSAWVMQELSSRGVQVGYVILVGVVVALVLGCLCGLINGLLITRAGLSPFVATLSMLAAATGVTSLINDGLDITNIPEQLGTIGSTFLGGWVPVVVLITAVITAGVWWMLARTRFGTWTYAIGSNAEAASRCGIPVQRQLVKVYMLSGVLAACAGLAYLTRFTSASPVAGENDELIAIAAVVIGGASMKGGTGRMLGTVVGTAILSVLVTGLVVANVETFWQEVATGAIVAGAVWADQFRSGLATR